MRLFITGGTGFLGSHFLRQAAGSGHELVAIRRAGSSNAIPLAQEPTWIESTLNELTEESLSGYDALVHFASHGVSPQKTDWASAAEVNTHQSTRLIEKACAAGIRKILICGSCFEYGRSGELYDFIPASAPLDPLGAYAASKAAFSMIANAMATSSESQFVLLRPFHFFGEGQHEQNFWPSLRAAAQSGGDFEMTAGEQLRDFQPVEETARAFLGAIDAWPGRNGQMHIANLGSGRPVTLAQFAREWWSRWNASGKLHIGALPYRNGEIMRYLPHIES